MRRKLLQKERRSATLTEQLTGPEPHIEPYGLADAPVPMIDFRGLSGERFALPYRLMDCATCKPNLITLVFEMHIVSIKGRNLTSLFDEIVRNRVVYVREDKFDHLPESETFVDDISVKGVELPPEEDARSN